MQATTGVQFIVDTIMEAGRQGTEAGLRAGGAVLPLQGASRMVLLREQQDLCTAMEQPRAAQEPFGHVAVDIHRDGGHVLAVAPVRAARRRRAVGRARLG